MDNDNSSPPEVTDASVGSLGNLHDLIARVLAERITGNDCTAADIQAAIKFLHDNGINAAGRKSKRMMAVADSVAGNVTKFPFQDDGEDLHASNG